MGENLKRWILVGKREGICSTPSPTWKFGLIQPDGSLIQESNFPTNTSTLSARKLGANLWEVTKMSKNGPNLKHNKELKVYGVPKQAQVPVEGPSGLQKIGIDSKKQVPTSLMQHNQRVKSAGQAQRPLSTASYCSSMEMAPYRTAISPNSSLEAKGKIGEPNYSLKTSTELLKVLNRIWSLEEKHALDMSLVKTLRNELDQSQAQIKQLLEEKKRDRKQIDSLMKQVTEDKEHDKIKDAVKLVRKEAKDERKLRRNSEKLCHKLANELSETKSSFSNALKDLEHERKARRLLEDLCDEFAKGVKDYEQEVRYMKHKARTDPIGKEGNDRLILHISEAWLDERMHMKLDDGRDIAEKPSVLDKLSFEIETFLRVKQKASESKLHAHSLESFHLNEPGSAPWNENEEDDSQIRGRKSLKNNYMEGSLDPCTFTRSYSPVKKWTSEITAADHGVSESCSRSPKSIKPNTLKAKLLEARREGQQSRARSSKGLSQKVA
ncbi:hypothetical protein ACJIZ3_018514 [Penstemon smallii]|uniref:Uncharacterized protein n=1 Tax=Penstemon smallii TaxID=265156 RepID=A0ABD3SYK9_9LAMI